MDNLLKNVELEMYVKVQKSLFYMSGYIFFFF